MNPPMHLPAFVNYSCQLCGWCCRQFDITFSREDYARLSKHDWGKLEPEMAGKKWGEEIHDAANPDPYRLRYEGDTGCVFLGPDSKCRMHKHVGETGKALGCSVYPFTFLSTPTGVYVGCRFSCQSIACGIGDSVARQGDHVRKQFELCVKAGHVPKCGESVRFEGRTMLAWADYLRLEELLIRILLRDDLPLVRRLFMAHRLIDILSQARRLDQVRGPKFRELVHILETSLLQEAEHGALPKPMGGIYKVIYRQFCFLFQHRQGGAYRELGGWAKLRVRGRNFRNGILFALNAGTVQLPGMTARVSLRAIAKMPAPELGAAEEHALSRFFAAKLFGKQHFGPLFFDYSLYDGLSFLILSSGVIMWYARALALARGAPKPETADILEAIRYVDFGYGYSRAPALALERVRVRMLSHADIAIRLALAQFR